MKMVRFPFYNYSAVGDGGRQCLVIDEGCALPKEHRARKALVFVWADMAVVEVDPAELARKGTEERYSKERVKGHVLNRVALYRRTGVPFNRRVLVDMLRFLGVGPRSIRQAMDTAEDPKVTAAREEAARRAELDREYAEAFQIRQDHINFAKWHPEFAESMERKRLAKLPMPAVKVLSNGMGQFQMGLSGGLTNPQRLPAPKRREVQDNTASQITLF